jgi:hypothetical protein
MSFDYGNHDHKFLYLHAPQINRDMTIPQEAGAVLVEMSL